jgi:ankyrin repeat protein
MAHFPSPFLSPRVADDDLMTPLMGAVREEHAAIVELLMAKGACVDAAARNGQTALATKDDPELVVLLLKGDGGVCLCVSDTRGYTPFMAAAEAGSDSILRLLLKKRAQVEAKSDRWKRSASRRGSQWTS